MPFFSSFAHFLLPDCCLLCGQSCSGHRALCEQCHGELPWLTNSCYRCALPLPAPHPFPLSGQAACFPSQAPRRQTCGQCQQTPPPFACCIAGFSFTYPIDNLIREYKYRRRLNSGKLLTGLLERRLREAYRDRQLPQVITAVPLHWRRLLTRGFNQAALTAVQLGKRFQIPVQDLSRRLRHTPRQQGARRQQRLHNLHGVFQITGDVTGRHIALVDDVVTTGATVSELTRALTNAGARRVDIWALARTPIEN